MNFTLILSFFYINLLSLKERKVGISVAKYLLFPAILITLVMLGITYFAVYRPLTKKKRCNKKTKGRVVGPSNYWYNDDIRMPLVEYVVNGKSYKLAGPRFRYVVTKSSKTPFHGSMTEYDTNLTTRDNLPEKLYVYSSSNSFVKISESPMMKLFPVGTEVDVYYNPKNPKDAYIMRYFLPSKWLVFILSTLTGLGILCCIVLLIRIIN